MITNLDKQNFLHKMLPELFENPDSQAMQTGLRNILLSDTNSNGKLYKYRSFDPDGYSLSNLENQTLHCTTPSKFNDPFECLFGIDASSITDALFEPFVPLLEEYYQIITGDIQLSGVSPAHQSVLTKLLNNDDLRYRTHHLIAESSDMDLNDPAVIRRLSELFVDIIRPITTQDSRGDSIARYLDKMPGLIQKLPPDSLRALAEESLDYQKIALSNGIVDDLDEIGLSVRLTKMYDPASASQADDFEAAINALEEQLKEKLENLFCIGCLCTNYKNKLMWSHYADGHKGFCIEYDFSHTEGFLPFPVVYSTERVKVPWGASISQTPEDVKQASYSLAMAILTKDEIWSYENEWRILIPQGRVDRGDVAMPPISGIYVGAACSDKDKVKLIDIARKLDIPVKQMEIDRGEYALHVGKTLFPL